MNTLILSILKHFAEAAFQAHLRSEVPKAAKHLVGANKGFPAQPTDADRAAFCHAASYWLLKEAGVPGAIAGAVRGLILDRVTAAASPKLSAGLTTEQATQVVADAEIAVAESLVL